jgi:hypothetical protein
VYRRSRRQARACSHRADAGLGENRNRRVDDGRVRDRWPRVPPCEPCGRRHWGTPKNINLISGVGSLHKSPIWRAVKQRGRKTSTATLLANGNVVFAGGSGDSGGGNGAYLFDPATESFTATGSMSVARLAQSATLQGDGTVLIAGGQVCPGNGTCPALASVEIYDPGAGTFSTTGSMLAARRFLGAPLLPDGTVLIAGGFGGVPQIPGQAPSTTAELYHPANPIKAPASFTNSSTGQAVLWNSVIGAFVTPGGAFVPAQAGDILSTYTNNLIEGSAIPPQVSVGGKAAKILYFGDAPGYPEYFQINFQVPGGVTPGPAIPVRLTYLNRSSNAVMIAVQGVFAMSDGSPPSRGDKK